MKNGAISETSADVLLHPVRLRVLMVLYGRHLTTQEIAASLTDVPPATLYRHLRTLAAAGIIAVVAQRSVRGTLEKVYGVTGEGTSLSPDPSQMTPEDWRHAFSIFTASLLGQFQLYLTSQEAEPVADGVSFRIAPLSLSDKELADLQDALGAVLRPALALEPVPGRRRRLLATILFPSSDLASDPKGKSEGEHE